MYAHMADRAQDLHPMKIHFVQWNQFKLPPLYQSAFIILFEKNDNTGVVIGCGIYDTARLAPPMYATNRNIFNQLFGIEFPCLNEMGKTPMSAIRTI